MQYLPLEVQVIILSHLYPVDVLACTLVDKQLHHAAEHNDVWASMIIQLVQQGHQEQKQINTDFFRENVALWSHDIFKKRLIMPKNIPSAKELWNVILWWMKHKDKFTNAYILSYIISSCCNLHFCAILYEIVRSPHISPVKRRQIYMCMKEPPHRVVDHIKKASDVFASSWQGYVDFQLAGTGNLCAAAIVGHNGVVWAKHNINFQHQQIERIIKEFGDRTLMMQEGMRMDSKKYLVIRADETVMRDPGMRGTGGAIAMKTKQTIIIGEYDDTALPGHAFNTAACIQDYLLHNNF